MYYTPEDNIFGSAKRMEIRWGATLEKDLLSAQENEDPYLWGDATEGRTDEGVPYVLVRSKIIAFGGDGAPGRTYNFYFAQAPTPLCLHVQYYSLLDDEDFLEKVVLPMVASLKIA